MLTSDIDAFLARLGITRSTSTGAQPVWTLNITNPTTPALHHSAYFDEKLSIWKIIDVDRSDKIVSDVTPPCADVEDGAAANDLEVTVQPASGLNSSTWFEALPRTRHSALFKATNWEATPLGPLHCWSYALRIHTHTLFSDSRASVIYWGTHRTALYNENAVPLMGPLHPSLMGSTFQHFMPELWDLFEPMFRSIEKDGKGLLRHGMELPLQRYGYIEESYWDVSLTGLKDDVSGYGGNYFSWAEVTRMVLRDRTTRLTNQLIQLRSSDLDHMWKQIHQVFVEYPRDIPMASFYTLNTNGDFQDQLRLGPTIGINANSTAIVKSLDISSTTQHPVLASLFRQARDCHRGYITLDSSKGKSYSAIIENVLWQGYGEPSKHVAVMCVKAGLIVKGYAVLGLNPRREFNSDHQQFLMEISRQLDEAVSRTTIADLTQQREQHLQQALTDSERRSSKMAQMAPVGIYELSADGALSWANRHFFEIMGVPHDRRDPTLFDWRDYIVSEDQEKANIEMGRCLMDKVEITDSLRLDRRWTSPGTPGNIQTEDEQYWVLYSASPDLRADGSVRALMGCITNISHLKWAEQLQARNAVAAEKERRRQEEFIDVISHEMRNPLSAITQCADSILESLQDIKQDSSRQTLVNIIKQNVEVAESVSFCASHQKRIIDDVLALSKLDSGLLVVTPVPFCLERVVNQTFKMFKAELVASSIDVRMILETTTAANPRTTLYADSARFTQIMVNLLTNAIKFTRTEAVRSMVIRYGVANAPPHEDTFGDSFQWQPTKRDRSSSIEESRDLPEELVYPYFAVSDSGKGIAGDSADRVFCKFEQADQRTHVNYGGSGLGLFISRELAEIQGGYIGIESQHAVGSTFAFYIKAKRLDSLPLETGDPRIAEGDTLSSPKGFKRHRDTGLNVLLVEDNLLNQRVLAKSLTKAGCTVCVANHGGEAIDLVLMTLNQPIEYATPAPKGEPRRFDCILMDWEMPICNGLVATKRIREIELQHKCPANLIVGITANARDDQITMAISAGMNSVLSKPFRVQDVLDRMPHSLQSESRQEP